MADTQEKPKRVLVRFAPQFLRELKIEAAKRDLSLQQLLVLACSNLLNGKRPKG